MASFLVLCNRCSAKVRFMTQPEPGAVVFCEACEVARLTDIPKQAIVKPKAAVKGG